MMWLTVVRWIVRKVLIHVGLHYAKPIIEPYEKDLRKLLGGIALILAGAIAAIVCGIVFTPLLALPGVAAFIGGIVLCGLAVQSGARHLRASALQGVALGHVVREHIRALRAGAETPAP